MANFNSSPNMFLPVPIVGVDPGPDWANNINSSLSVIDGHTHASGSGVQVTPLGMNINTDLLFLGNNATQLRTTRFNSQISAIPNSGTDVGCLYIFGNELYYNDYNQSHQVQLTSNGSVFGTPGSITGLPNGTAGVAYSGGTYTFSQSTGVDANIDAAAYIMRYPGSHPSPSGNYIALQAPTGLATGYAWTLPTTLPATLTSFPGISTAGIISNVAPDNSSIQISGSTLQVKAGGITNAMIGAKNIGQSSAIGTVSFSSATLANVTGLSVTLTTTGRPCYVGLVAPGSPGFFSFPVNSGSAIIFLAVAIDSSAIGEVEIATCPSNGVWAGHNSYSYISTALAAGSHTFQIQMAVSNTFTASINNYALVVYEL